ncbi:Retrovirusrelated Pol polyprotein from transposon TNT 1-94, putative [Acanthamoeba castellanii str. Neff]|uniref:Retrovirusrelated Pol polyprotein from transposon TNT 1-94, putative n=1 Tax=Acanthamoeba castellanii (strain ATCC 30010 / Neff) TaxID=1257118 RepID=L8GMV1_ACACF|nr:Retrovirusrelated Pol polyprotein from transposon TNT 1-94, putative [Acanthamoeba castellanii str. Neff]ELR14134.1 Retrovirusrelated Pol polyprotein from transposon TNT 1-94, putative [Acanthamoeba castellanii str. Neff]
MQEEFKALMHNGTYVLVPLPQGRKPISTQWLYKVKLHTNSLIDCYKARWVAKGFTQRFSINYNSTFSPVIWIENLWLLLAFVNACNLEIHQVDVDMAFLHAKLTEEIYISQPEGFSLYGLKQAPLEWNCTIDAHLCKSHFEPTDLDPCIYIRQGHHLAIVALYVNDCTIITHKSKLRGVKQIIADSFLIKDLREATSILGIKIQCDQSLGKLYIQQRGKINNILTTFGLTNSKPVSTLMLPNLQLPVNTKQHDTFKYHSAIGMLLYLAHASRPDILFPIAYLSHFANNFSPKHVTTVKCIMHYLAGTANLAICYSCDLYNDRDVATHVPIRYCDANWGNIEVNRQSVSGVVFIFCRGAISWSVKTQKCIALSSTEAELNAISEATRQALYVCKHLPALGVDTQQPLSLFNDNQSALAIIDILSSTYHGHMKHYDIKLTHLRDTTS